MVWSNFAEVRKKGFEVAWDGVVVGLGFEGGLDLFGAAAGKALPVARWLLLRMPIEEEKQV